MLAEDGELVQEEDYFPERNPYHELVVQGLSARLPILDADATELLLDNEQCVFCLSYAAAVSDLGRTRCYARLCYEQRAVFRMLLPCLI